MVWLEVVVHRYFKGVLIHDMRYVRTNSVSIKDQILPLLLRQVNISEIITLCWCPVGWSSKQLESITTAVFLLVCATWNFLKTLSLKRDNEWTNKRLNWWKINTVQTDVKYTNTDTLEHTGGNKMNEARRRHSSSLRRQAALKYKPSIIHSVWQRSCLLSRLHRGLNSRCRPAMMLRTWSLQHWALQESSHYNSSWGEHEYYKCHMESQWDLSS